MSSATVFTAMVDGRPVVTIRFEDRTGEPNLAWRNALRDPTTTTFGRQSATEFRELLRRMYPNCEFSVHRE